MKEQELIKMYDDLEGEEWKEIIGFNGRYYVSNKGRVKSRYGGKERLKALSYNSSGYQRVELCIQGKRYRPFVHRLVAEYFIPNDDPLQKTTVDHIDGQKDRNVSENLQWLSLSDNIRAYFKLKKERNKKELPQKELQRTVQKKKVDD